MAYNNDDRQMFHGDWTCSECNGAITELPFEPREDRLGDLKCRDCHKKTMPDRSRSNGGGFRSDRPAMVQGNWTCAGCGGEITQLPFNPDPSRLGDLKCRDCHRNSRG